MSDWIDVISRGSVLGVPLFDIYINNIRKVVIDVLVLMFADDTKVARKIESQEDRQKFQEIIDNLAKWAKTWEMELNETMYKIVHCRNNPKYVSFMNGKKMRRRRRKKTLVSWCGQT